MLIISEMPNSLASSGITGVGVGSGVGVGVGVGVEGIRGVVFVPLTIFGVSTNASPGWMSLVTVKLS